MTVTEQHHDTAPGPAPRPRRRPAALLGAGLAVGLVTGSVLGAVGWDLVDERTAGTAQQAEDAPAADATAGDGADDAAEGGAGEGDVALPPLAWAPPELEDPEVVQVTEDDTDLKLDQEQDYELVLPDEPLTRPLTVYGGNDVVLVGGEVRLDEPGAGSRGLYLRDQTGTVHVEGLLLSGSELNEGINLDQREGAVVQLQNIHVAQVEGSRDGHHADLLQVWAGPQRLLVDGFTGTTGYQGLFLLPKQFGDQPEPEVFDLRRMDITGADDSAYMLWRDDLGWPIQTQDVWVQPGGLDPDDRRAFLWDREGEDSWEGVEVGRPPGGPFVPDGAAGVGYVSPGYGGSG